MNKEYEKELDEIIMWGYKEQKKIYDNSIGGLDTNREECKKIDEQVDKKISELRKKYGLN